MKKQKLERYLASPLEVTLTKKCRREVTVCLAIDRQQGLAVATDAEGVPLWSYRLDEKTRRRLPETLISQLALGVVGKVKGAFLFDRTPCRLILQSSLECLRHEAIEGSDPLVFLANKTGLAASRRALDNQFKDAVLLTAQVIPREENPAERFLRAGNFEEIHPGSPRDVFGSRIVSSGAP